jgi:type II secretory pathway component PulF
MLLFRIKLFNYLKVKRKEKGFRLSSFIPQWVGVKDLLVFTQELSTLISAGLPDLA